MRYTRAQVQESPCEDIHEAADEVALKLSLWEGRVEFDDLVATWQATHFESLDVAAFEESIARCGARGCAGRGRGGRGGRAWGVGGRGMGRGTRRAARRAGAGGRARGAAGRGGAGGGAGRRAVIFQLSLRVITQGVGSGSACP